MGFECGFYTIPILDWDQSREDNIKLYDHAVAKIEYNENSWCHEIVDGEPRFKSFEDYWNAYFKDEKFDATDHDVERVSRFIKKNRENGLIDSPYSRYLCLESWCSQGRVLDSYIMDLVRTYNNCEDRNIMNIVFTRDMIKKLKDYVADIFDDYFPKAINISSGFIVKQDEENNEEVRITRHIDGIEYHDVDGKYNNFGILYLDNELDDETLLRGSFDELFFIMSLRECIAKMEMINQNSNVIYYSRSW